jgi:hypothetical protein
MAGIYLLFILIFIIGLFFIVLGWYKYKKFNSAKEICLYPLSQNSKSILFAKAGNYTIGIVGGSLINNFSVSILSEIENKNIATTEHIIKHRFFRKGKFGIYYYNFCINKVVDYTIIINHPEKIVVKNSTSKLISLLENEVSKENLFIIIKEYSSPSSYIFALLLFIIGLWILLLNVTYFLYKLGILVPTN